MREADNLTTFMCPECHGNLGAYTSWNPLGHTGPVTRILYLLPLTDSCGRVRRNISPCSKPEELNPRLVCRLFMFNVSRWIFRSFRQMKKQGHYLGHERFVTHNNNFISHHPPCNSTPSEGQWLFYLPKIFTFKNSMLNILLCFN